MGMARRHTSHDLPKASSNLQRNDVASTRQRAVIWLVGHTVYYIITRQNMMSLEDYVEFLKRTRWKTYNKKGGRQIFGNYLSICMRERNRNGGDQPNFKTV
jgi:hypothetical protein